MPKFNQPTADDLASWLRSDDMQPDIPYSQADTEAQVDESLPPLPGEGHEFPAQDIPKIASNANTGERSDGLRDAIKGIDIATMYSRYCGKMEPKLTGKRESVMVSCPIPGHIDKNPSAWLNLDSGLWYCAACAQGGDGIDIYLMNVQGLAPGDRSGGAFRKAVEDISQDFGFSPVSPTPMPSAAAPPPVPKEPPPVAGEPESSSPSDPSIPTASQAPSVAIVSPVQIEVIDPEVDDQGNYIPSEPFQWWDIYHPEGFRHTYMRETAVGRLLPHEFHACMADILVALAAGHNVIKEESDPVYGNIYACMLGPTGIGKSRTMQPALELLGDKFPFNDLDGNGVRILKTPGSGEALIVGMEHIRMNPVIMAEGPCPVVGLLSIDELSTVVARSARKGSTLQPHLIEMYSAADRKMMTEAISSGAHTAMNPYLCLVAGTQPDILPKLLNEDDLASGFLNRFMFYVATRPAEPPGYDLAVGDPPYTLGWSRNMFEAMEQWAKQKHALKFAAGADTDYSIALRGENLLGFAWKAVPILARLELLFKKLILLNCVDVQVGEITSDNIERAVAQIRYFISAYGFTRKSMEANDTEKCMDRILKIVDTPDGITEGRLRNRFHNTKYIDLFDKVLKHGIDTGLIVSTEMASGAKGGRKTKMLTRGEASLYG